MSQELASLAITALDDLQAMSRLQELLEICLEELDQPTEKSYLRLELLLDCYQASMMLYLDELKVSLEGMRRQTRKLVEQVDRVAENSNPSQT